MDKLDSSIEKLNLKKYADNQLLLNVSNKLKVKPEYILLAVLVVSVLLITLTSWGNLILSIVLIYLYPAYKTYKAREGSNPVEKQRWLIYWTVFGFIFSIFTIINIFTPFRLSNIILTAVLFAVYCALVDGHAMIYDNIMKPALLFHQNTIDKYIQLAKDETKDVLNRATKAATNKIIQ